MEFRKLCLSGSLTNRMPACNHARMDPITQTSEKDGLLSATSRNGKEPLQVRIPVGIKRAFKSQAALLGLEPNELFVKVWEHYERTRPTAPEEN